MNLSQKNTYFCFSLVMLLSLCACIPANAVIATGQEPFWRGEWSVGEVTSERLGVAAVPFATGLSRPISVVDPGSEEGLIVAEQEGLVKEVARGDVGGTVLLDLREKVSCCGEQGLLSVALDPAFRRNGYLYAAFTGLDGELTVARYALHETAPLETETLLFSTPEPDITHNGGQLQFGPDGFLYLSLGDGGYRPSPRHTAQDLSTPLGKLIRLPLERAPEQGYEIVAYGLRNPWRFSFDRKTGAIFIGDVGQSRAEEVNFIPPGETGLNFGWPAMEGSVCFGQDTAECAAASSSISPIGGFAHGEELGCSITGGYRYRGRQLPQLYGAYLYADFCSGRVWGTWFEDGWQTAELFDTDFNVSTFGEDRAGELYVADYGLGVLYALVPQGEASSER